MSWCLGDSRFNYTWIGVLFMTFSSKFFSEFDDSISLRWLSFWLMSLSLLTVDSKLELSRMVYDKGLL